MQVPPSSNILQAISAFVQPTVQRAPGSAATQTQQAVRATSAATRGGESEMLAGRDPQRPLPRGSLIDILA